MLSLFNFSESWEVFAFPSSFDKLEENAKRGEVVSSHSSSKGNSGKSPPFAPRDQYPIKNTVVQMSLRFGTHRTVCLWVLHTAILLRMTSRGLLESWAKWHMPFALHCTSTTYDASPTPMVGQQRSWESEGHWAAWQGQKLSRGNVYPAAARCLTGPSGYIYIYI